MFLLQKTVFQKCLGVIGLGGHSVAWLFVFLFFWLFVCISFNIKERLQSSNICVGICDSMVGNNFFISLYTKDILHISVHSCLP